MSFLRNSINVRLEIAENTQHVKCCLRSISLDALEVGTEFLFTRLDHFKICLSVSKCINLGCDCF
ncbi:hypothetical protein DOS48_04945 [Halorubrum sp. PV6]|nr:hypothetical protein DOS48_04945 [Halorubrum sp. PV6]